MGESEDFEIIDGLAAQRLGHEALISASNVRVLRTPETEAAGWADAVGEVMGETKPSRSRVEVIGLSDEDYAINIWSEERHGQAWFAPHLIEPA